jgi:hypothetical protein
MLRRAASACDVEFFFHGIPTQVYGKIKVIFNDLVWVFQVKPLLFEFITTKIRRG